MSYCEKLREQLWDIAELEDNEIPAQVKEHLETCSECAAELAEIKKIKTELPSLNEEAPEELLENVMYAVRKEPRRVTSINKMIKICAASAAAILLCVFTAYNFMMSDQKNEDMIAPDDGGYVNSSTSMGSVADKSVSELPSTTSDNPLDPEMSIQFERFYELRDFDYSNCQYSGIFPDDISILYFASEDYAEKIEFVLNGDCFKNEISDRTLYIGQLDNDKMAELDGICDIKYTRASFGSAEYFAVITVKE